MLWAKMFLRIHSHLTACGRMNSALRRITDALRRHRHLRRHARPDARGQRRGHARAAAAGQGRAGYRQDDARRRSCARDWPPAGAMAHQVDNQGAASAAGRDHQQQRKGASRCVPPPLLLSLHQVPRQRDDDAHRRCPLSGFEEGAAQGSAGGFLRAARGAGSQEKALHLGAPRLAQAPPRRGHPARGAPEHGADLRRAAADGELWRLWYTSVPAPDETGPYIDAALKMREDLGAMPFAVRDNAAGDIVGCTRYFNVDAANRRLEIGHTWYATHAQRTAINTECKLLLLTHAFEKLQGVAVELRTHWFNHASRDAIARLGAKQDGVLRNHQILPDGSYRDTAVFSIIENEWPAVKRQLTFLLERK